MPARVLVVEDSAAVRGLIVMILERAGHQVIPVSDASSALTAVGSLATLDLVICDVHLHGQSGIGLGDRLREKVPGLKILYMSGQIVHAPLPDDSAFMLKPFRPEALVAKVKEMTGG
jgi:DNA-binding NtrC family response regulator